MCDRVLFDFKIFLNGVYTVSMLRSFLYGDCENDVCIEHWICYFMVYGRTCNYSIDLTYFKVEWICKIMVVLISCMSQCYWRNSSASLVKKVMFRFVLFGISKYLKY